MKGSVCRAMGASAPLYMLAANSMWLVGLFVLNAFYHMIVKKRFSYLPSLGLIILFERLTELRRAQTAIYRQDVTTDADEETHRERNVGREELPRLLVVTLHWCCWH